MKKSNPSLIKLTLREYIYHIRQYPLLASGMVLMIPLSVVTFGVLPQLFLARILQKLSNHSYIPHDIWASFGWDLSLYLGCTLLGGIVFWRVAVILLWSLEMRVQRDIYQRIFSHLTSQSLRFHADRFGGSLVSQTSKFANAYVRLVDTAMFDLLPLIVTFIATFIIIYPRSHVIALALLATSLLFIVIATVLTKAVRHLRAKEAAEENRQTGALADAITNVLTIKSFAGENLERKRFAQVTEDVRGATKNVMVASMKREIGFSFGTIVIQAIAVIGALVAIVYGSADISTMYLAIVYTGQITQRLWEFALHTLRELNRAFGDAEEMVKILQVEPEIKDVSNPKPSSIMHGDIVWKDVVFTHGEADESLFQSLSLQIKPGEKVGLVGPSGSGKTTFTRLLQRFSDIDSGSISIDGQDIRNIRQRDLHQQIAFVPQEPLLFHRSLAENISYGSGPQTQKAIEDAAKMAKAHDFIMSLPEGYETLVGERGVKLSGGQRQRVAIARAMLKNAPILILDEATSALDSESEVMIQQALWELMKGRTAVVIAHRLSTIQKMDRIIVLEDGAITEQGTHKELLTLGGTYAKLWAHQSGGFLED